MNLVVSTEQRFCRDRDGNLWSDGGMCYDFCCRYLSVFDEVRVAARVLDVDWPQEGWKRVQGPRVALVALPHYLGPLQFAMKRRAVSQELRSVIGAEDAVILRVPSPIGGLAAKHLESRGQPYGVEVVGDPYDVLSPGAMQHPLRPFLRWKLPRELRRLVGHAAAAAYVTEYALQKRYPIGKDGFATHYSSIDLPSQAFTTDPRTYELEQTKRIRVASVGTLHQMYKAPDVAIAAVAQCVKNGVDLDLVWVGGGKYHSQMEDLARNSGCADRFQFTGQLAKASVVREVLDRADLFILPSRQEGLPRSVIEAMARGLPCIASTVGGNSELLPKECLVPPNDAGALAAKITEFCRNPERMEAMSKRNLRKAREYRDEVLSSRRTEFYEHIREATSRYLKETR